MVAIPRRFLIHSAMLRTVSGEDCFGNKERSSPTELRFIRVDSEESEKTRERDMLNIEAGGKATLIYDCVNSLPRGVNFETGQEAEFMGKSYRITKIQRLYDENRLHHIEAELTEVGI